MFESVGVGVQDYLPPNIGPPRKFNNVCLLGTEPILKSEVRDHGGSNPSPSLRASASASIALAEAGCR